MTAVVAAGVLGLAAPAYAHHSVLSGTTECSDSEHVVTWSITAVSVVHLPMTITSATATNNGVTYAVTGYTSPVNDEDTTTATSVLPAGSTGLVTLHVHSTWPDDVEYTDETSVELQHDCSTTTTGAPTTTSTTEAPTTSTTEAPTTSTTESTTTTTISVQGSTTVPVVVPTTTTPEQATTTLGEQGSTSTTQPGAITGQLPHTGGNARFPILFGLSCLVGGAMFVVRRRRAWSRP